MRRLCDVDLHQSGNNGFNAFDGMRYGINSMRGGKKFFLITVTF
jgi:hypothetical protein